MLAASRLLLSVVACLALSDGCARVHERASLAKAKRTGGGGSAASSNDSARASSSGPDGSVADGDPELRSDGRADGVPDDDVVFDGSKCIDLPGFNTANKTGLELYD